MRGFAAGLAAVEETVAVEEFAGERGDGQVRVCAAQLAGGGERFGDDAVRQQTVEQRARPWRAT